MTTKIRMNPKTGIIGVVMIAIVMIGIFVATSVKSTYVPQNDDPDEGDDLVTTTGNITVPVITLTSEQLNARARLYVQQQLYSVSIVTDQWEQQFGSRTYNPDLTYVVQSVSKIGLNDYNVVVRVVASVSKYWRFDCRNAISSLTLVGPNVDLSSNVFSFGYTDQNNLPRAQQTIGVGIQTNENDAVFGYSNVVCSSTFTLTEIMSPNPSMGMVGLYQVDDTISVSFVCSGRMTVIA